MSTFIQLCYPLLPSFLYRRRGMEWLLGISTPRQGKTKGRGVRRRRTARYSNSRRGFRSRYDHSWPTPREHRVCRRKTKLKKQNAKDSCSETKIGRKAKENQISNKSCAQGRQDEAAGETDRKGGTSWRKGITEKGYEDTKIKQTVKATVKAKVLQKYCVY